MRIAALLRSAWAPIRRLADDPSGVAAVEFALVLPVMLTLYIGGVSVTEAISIDRKVTLISYTVADLTAQASSVNAAEITNILNAASAAISPYSAATLKVTVSAVKIDANQVATVDWSETLNGTKRSGNVSSLIKPELRIPNTGLIWGEASYTYKPAIGYVITGTISLADEIFLRPRQSAYVTKQ